MYLFGNKSNERLSTADEKLQKVAERALSFGVMDFSIIEGHRSVERQKDSSGKPSAHRANTPPGFKCSASSASPFSV